MNRTILALLFTVALTGTAQACSWNKFNASAEAVAEAQNNPVLPPVVEQTNRSQHIDATPVNLAASTIMSWTHKIKTLLDTRLIQENCLTTAIYFEARSESELGQLAVATVILNRVQVSKSSSSICGVVYKGSSHLNACQFSFACDGKLDLVDDTRAWKTARTVTALALADNTEMKDGRMQILATATNYHTDYVDPYWSKSLTRLTKIGHHIFYSQS
jgi:spore germination cell wall hydrolase CwlJ-like protein